MTAGNGKKDRGRCTNEEIVMVIQVRGDGGRYLNQGDGKEDGSKWIYAGDTLEAEEIGPHY